MAYWLPVNHHAYCFGHIGSFERWIVTSQAFPDASRAGWSEGPRQGGGLALANGVREQGLAFLLDRQGLGCDELDVAGGSQQFNLGQVLAEQSPEMVDVQCWNCRAHREFATPSRDLGTHGVMRPFQGECRHAEVASRQLSRQLQKQSARTKHQGWRVLNAELKLQHRSEVSGNCTHLYTSGLTS